MKRYQIVGYLNGESHYYRRNIAEDSVLDEVQAARAEGWVNVQAVVEAF